MRDSGDVDDGSSMKNSRVISSKFCTHVINITVVSSTVNSAPT